jgi:hypothetical protein
MVVTSDSDSIFALDPLLIFSWIQIRISNAEPDPHSQSRRRKIMENRQIAIKSNHILDNKFSKKGFIETKI